VYYVIDDVISLPLRPLVLLNHLVHIPWLAAILAQPGFVAHLIASITILLVCVSIVALLHPPLELGHIVYVPFFLDACTQLCGCLAWMYDPDEAAKQWNYPLSHTAFGPLLVQLPIACALWLPCDFPFAQYACFVIAFCSRLASVHEQAASSSWFIALVLNGIACIAVVFFMTPSSVWEWLGKGCLQMCQAILSVCSFAYLVVTRLWPPFVMFVWRILSSPLMVGVHRILLMPCWRVISPIVLPAVTLATAVTATKAVWETATATTDRPLEWSDVALASAQGFCATTSIMATLVLMVHAVGWNWVSSASFLACVRVVACPCALVQRMCSGRISRWIWRSICCIADALGTFAIEMPVLSIPVTLLFGGGLFYTLYLSPPSPSDSPSSFFLASWLPSYASLVFAHVMSTLTSLRETPLAQLLSDSAFAVVFVAGVQSATYRVCASNILEPAMRSSRYASLPPQELQELADAMPSPRRCAHCWFGPVDHTGCNNLASHHGERRGVYGAAAAVSNACPRCGWFTHNLSAWPAWQAAGGDVAGPGRAIVAGRAVYTQRAWEEFVMVVRASAKALVFPLALLRIAAYLELPASVGALLALSYIVPWVFENEQVFSGIYRPPPHIVAPRRAAGAVGAGADAFAAADCGHRVARRPLVEEAGDSLASLLAEAVPDRIFFTRDESCSICLDEWTEDALALVAAAPLASEAAVSLREKTNPACLVLPRCGHVLHLACAQDILTAGAGRHQRCPLCRQPLTLAGAISASLFN